MVFDFTLDEDDVASLDGMDIVSNTYLRGARDDVVHLVFSMGVLWISGPSFQPIDFQTHRLTAKKFHE